jgi:hypothetical protein
VVDIRDLVAHEAERVEIAWHQVGLRLIVSMLVLQVANGVAIVAEWKLVACLDAVLALGVVVGQGRKGGSANVGSLGERDQLQGTKGESGEVELN